MTALNCWISFRMPKDAMEPEEKIKIFHLGLSRLKDRDIAPYKIDAAIGLVYAAITESQINALSDFAIVGYDIYHGPKESNYVIPKP